MKLPDFENIETTLIFRSQPKPIPGDLRPLWRISIIILILKLASWGGKSTLGRLHVLNWAIRTKENRKKLREVIAKKITPDTVIVRVEPSLNRAIDFACAEGFVKSVSGNRIRLTRKGELAADILLEQNDLLKKERQFLKEIGKSGLTENAIQSLFLGRT
jgi:ribosomal protein L31E